MASLGSYGFLVLNPLTEHASFDLVAYKDGKFFRIQVKYSKAKENKISVGLRSCWSDKHGTHIKAFDSSEVDLIAVYCPDTECCYYLLAKEVNNNLTLRLSPPKNNQVKGIRMAKDYMRVP